eukprot:5883578-Pyramimonas_sp.AAC.1
MATVEDHPVRNGEPNLRRAVAHVATRRRASWTTCPVRSPTPTGAEGASESPPSELRADLS